MTTISPSSVTDSKFNALKAKLRELFELDKSDLDFGIYRIIAAKNKEVTEFLDRQLKDVVKATLAAHGAGAADQVRNELDKTVASLRAAEVPDEQIQTNKKVADLRAKLDAAGGAAAADLEADIYNHLLAFFGRYYDEGDFISQRRYKGDTYAIPYSGEEVTLHWANKDQYYIKSGEWHKDYRFNVGDKTVRFKLVEATHEVGNNKEPEEAKRRYILAAENPIEVSAKELSLRFEFRAPKPSDSERAGGAVAIFGKEYAKPTNPKKGDEREQFCADAERRFRDALGASNLSSTWEPLVTKIVPKDTPGATETEDKPLRTILGKHLDHFTARNTFDYFIHKRLGQFLSWELDFYIKNEVVRMDDIEKLPPEHLARVQGKVKSIRAVAGRIIAFLGSLEDFQKRMWLKKKFVLNTNWLVTVDRIPPRLRDIVAANEAQWKEWESLGFRPERTGDTGLFGGAAWGTRAYLDACDKLVVDTRFFELSLKHELLASPEILSGADAVDASTSGELVSSWNTHALRTLRQKYLGTLAAVYIDPPYNTDASAIIYKNDFKHSAWMSLIDEGILESAKWLHPVGVFSLAIDDEQVAQARYLLQHRFPRELGVAAVRSNPQSRKTKGKFSPVHEYSLFYGNSSDATPGSLEITEKRLARYPKEDAKGRFSWMNFIRTGNNDRREDRPRLYYPIYVSDSDALRVPRMTWDDERGEYSVHESPCSNESPVYPLAELNGVRIEKNWHRGDTSLMEDLTEYRVRRSADGLISIDFKTRMDEDSLPTTWWDQKEYASANYGAAQMKDRFGTNPFDYPKALGLVRDCLLACNVSESSTVLDFFAGSGTTAEAVLGLNRSDNGKRRFVLVEMGRHYHTVVKPRTAKAIYSPDWKDGRAQSHDKGVSALVKYFALESYEDALNNLPTPTGVLLAGVDAAAQDALITYSLDLEVRPHLLNLDAFRDPWGYTINAQLAGDAEIKRHRVDLVETFNYLIGLKVCAYGPLERYSADFERAAHADGLGRMKLTGRLRRDANGPYVFQRVEGELNDGNSTRVLVVWRKLTDDPEKDAAVLDAWMARHRESTRERTEHRDYHLIYINGPVTLPQPTAEIRTVYPTEETFKIKMFEDTDSASATGGTIG